MKKQILMTGLFFIFLMLTLISCKKNDQLEASIGDLIIGRWEVQSERQVYYLETVKKFEYIYYYETDELAYELTSGGSIIQYRAGYNPGTTTYTLNGNTIIIENGDVDIEWINVSSDGNTLTWTETGTYVDGDVTYDVEDIFTAAKTSK